MVLAKIKDFISRLHFEFPDFHVTCPSMPLMLAVLKPPTELRLLEARRTTTPHSNATSNC